MSISSNQIFCPLVKFTEDDSDLTKAQSKAVTTSGQRAVFLVNLLWPIDFIINIYFMNSNDPNLQWMNISNIPSDYLDPLYSELQTKVDPITLVKRIFLDRISPLVRLNFNFVSNVSKSHVRILFDSSSGSSWSRIGYSLNPNLTQPTMVFNRLDVATVIHEICHMLGMGHEHQNPRNNPIQWNREAVFCYYKQLNFDPVNLINWTNDDIEKNVLKRLNMEATNGSEYDAASIMVYSFDKSVNCDPQSFLCGCNCDRNQKSCTCPDDDPKNPSQCDVQNFTCKCSSSSKTMDLTMNGMFVRPNFKLSPTDIFWLENAYPKSGIRKMDMLPTKAFPAPAYNEFANSAAGMEFEIQTFVDKYYLFFILGLLIILFGIVLFYLNKKSKRVSLKRISKVARNRPFKN